LIKKKGERKINNKAGKMEYNKLQNIFVDATPGSGIESNRIELCTTITHRILMY
jgi:hypothetical protein